MDSPSEAAPARSGSILRATLIGGVAGGVCDFIFAVVYYHAAWSGIARSISRGLLSKELAYGGPGWVVALGVGLHFVIALGAAAAFVFARQKISWLARFPGPAGLIYGALVYFFMNWVVVPHSAIARYPASVDWGALVGHMVLVGLPIALTAHWFGPRKRAG